VNGSADPRPPSRPARRGPLRIGAAVALVLAALIITTGPAAAISGVRWPVQSRGDRGTDVLAIQLLLRDRLGPDADPTTIPPADGVFGAATDTAVRAFQAAGGLTMNGIVTSATWIRLVHGLATGATGDAVRALQIELVEKRHAAVVVDSVFLAETETAVLAFQAHMALPRTGTVDSATWRGLTWHYELPRFSSTSLCDYSVGNGLANWGTAEAIDNLEAAGRRMVRAGYGRIAVGDISLEHGGDIAGHETHERGLDIDIRPLRKANDQCAHPTRWTSTAYDRAATRTMIKALRALGRGHVKLIYFNDPVLIREGLTRWHSGHDDHLHVRFCEAIDPLAAYDC
jgi:peptidoglycan hydrolase-like protein with peptidoglycan-binding domain